MRNRNRKSRVTRLSVRAKTCDSHDSEASEDARSKPQVSITIINPLDIIRLAETQPNDAADSCQIAIKTLSDGFLNRKYELLGAAVGIAFNMLAVQGEWRKFCRNDYWKHFKRGPKDSLHGRHKALSYVMRYVFLARTTNEINLTNRYAKMLEKEFNTGVAPRKIATIIHEYGGIEAMRRARVASRKEILKRQLKKDAKYLDDLRDEPRSEPIENEDYYLTKGKFANIKAALDLFCRESKIYFSSRTKSRK